MRYFITSDIHGYYSVLKKELEAVGFNKEKDTLITLGDNFDRGPENWEVYKFLSSLPNVILVRGNHEDCLIDLINRGYPRNYDFHNGTVGTLEEVKSKYDINGDWEYFEPIINTEFYKWLTSDKWVDKVEFDNLVLTHATVPNEKFPSFENSRWANPTINRIPGKILICGHWFAWLAKRDYDNDFNEDDWIALTHKVKVSQETLNYFYRPYIDKDLIMIDACTPITKKCNILIYNDKTKVLSYKRKKILKNC